MACQGKLIWQMIVSRSNSQYEYKITKQNWKQEKLFFRINEFFSYLLTKPLQLSAHDQYIWSGILITFL